MMIHLRELERALLNAYKVLLGNKSIPNTRITKLNANSTVERRK
ncbi:hypothetical protein [Listeria cossartiae]|nr:hypothetical protein [Listeria cossartiae]